MGWIQTGRVVLVWPARSRGPDRGGPSGSGSVLNRRLDLVLLSRQSRSLGGQLALVTADPDVRDNARQLGISTFRSVREAQENRWNRPSRRRSPGLISGHPPARRLEDIPRPEVAHSQLAPALRIAVFALGAIAVFSIAAVLFPSAEVRLTPQMEQQQITFAVTASQAAGRINLSGILPMRTTRTIVEGRSSIPTTGTIQFPTQPAKGAVTFTNLTDQAVEIPRGTIVSNLEGTVQLATDRDARLAPGPATTVDVPVTATLPGTDSNLTTGKVQAVEGDLGVFLSVTNLGPLTRGEDEPSPAANLRDREQLRQDLIATLEQTATDEIRRSLEAGDIILDAAPELANILEESYTPSANQPASELSLNLRLEYQTFLVTGADLTDLAEAVLEANLPEGYQSMPGTLEIEHLTEVRFGDPSTATWRLRANRMIRATPDLETAITLIQGQTPARAVQRLLESESVRISSPPQVLLSPSWWPLVPFLPFRITLHEG